MSVHPNVAIRAYLKLAGLPEPKQQDLERVRAILLGQDAKDPNVVLSVTASKDTAQAALNRANFEVLKGS